MTLPALASRAFDAQTIRVRGWRAIEMRVNLDFGVTAQRTFYLDGLSFTELPPEIDEHAQHCLVLLAGGRTRMLVRPDISSRAKWHRMPDITARVYLCQKMHDAPIGYIEHMPEIGGPALELSPYMNWLHGHDFDHRRVLENLNGKS